MGHTTLPLAQGGTQGAFSSSYYGSSSKQRLLSERDNVLLQFRRYSIRKVECKPCQIGY